jgi:hypothetical protein
VWSAACNSWAIRANLSLIDMSCGGSDSVGIVDVCDTEADRREMMYAKESVKVKPVLFTRRDIIAGRLLECKSILIAANN